MNSATQLPLSEAILSGASVQDLESQWLSMGETTPLHILALGGETADTFGGLNGWDALVSELGRKRDKREYETLKKVMQHGAATPADIARFRELAVALKGIGRSN